MQISKIHNFGKKKGKKNRGNYFSRHCLVLPFELPLITKKNCGTSFVSRKKICADLNTTKLVHQICNIYISSESNFNVLSDGIIFLV